MSEEVKGSVWLVRPKKLDDNRILYSIMMSDEKWYGFGETKPEVKDGDGIKLSYEKKGDYRNLVEVIQTWPGAGEKMPEDKKTSKKGAAPYKKGGGGWSKGPEDHAGQAAGNALTNATNLVIACIEKDILKLPAKKDDKYDAVMGYIQSTAGTLLSISIGNVIKVAPNSPLKALITDTPGTVTKEAFDKDTANVESFDGKEEAANSEGFDGTGEVEAFE